MTTEYSSGLHIYDLHASPKIGNNQINSHLKKGWKLYKLLHKDSYCSFGAAGIYQYCFWDGATGLKQVTNKALHNFPDLDSVPTLTFDRSMVILKVPFETKAEAKSAGAEWLSMFAHWGCIPREKERFAKWLTDPLIVVHSEADRVQLEVPSASFKEAVSAGAFRALAENGSMSFYCFRDELERYKHWLPDDINANEKAP